MTGWARGAVALVTGVVVLVALFPFSGIDRQPPECYAVLGYVVPCGAGVSLAVGSTAVTAVVLGLWLSGRR